MGIIIFTSASLLAQCPDRDALWSRLSNLRHSKLDPQQQLTSLLSSLDSLKNCSYKFDSTHAYLLRKIADVYIKQGDYLKAIEFRRQAAGIVSKNAGKPFVRVETLPGIYYYISVAYDSLGNFSEKMKALDSCATIAARLKYVDISVLTALYTQVEYYFDIGDYHRCIDYAEKCRLLGGEYSKKNIGYEKNVGESYVLSSLGWQVNALLNLNKYESAEVLLQNKIEEYSKARLTNYFGLVYGQLAMVEKHKGNFKQSLLYYNKSLLSYQRSKDSFNCKQTLKDIGHNIYFTHLNDVGTALDYYKKALRYATTDNAWYMEDVFESADIFTNIAKVYVKKGLYDSAFKYFQHAFDQIKPGLKEEGILHSSLEDFRKNKKIYYLSNLVIEKGDAYLHKFKRDKLSEDLKNAATIYKKADLLLDKIKTIQSDLQSKLFWRSDSRRLYENAIEACYLQGNTTDAFYFFEKSRAVLLADQLNEQQWMGEKEILKLTQLKKSILNLERELSGKKNTGVEYAAFQSQIFSAKQDLDRLEQSIKAKNPLYYQNFLDTGFISFGYTQQNLLNDNKVLLEIFSGDSAVYVLFITSRHSFLTRVNKKEYETTVNKYIAYISNGSLLNRDFAGYVGVAFQLYSLLFKDKLLPGQRIIISPDGQYFPFESLVSNSVGQSPRYLLHDHAVSYTYSVRFLMNDFNPVAGNGKTFMGVAPVTYPSYLSLASLWGSDQSLQRIGNYFQHSVKQVAIDASRNNFLRQFSDYRIIQLYTHAADSSVNNEPVIYFADSALYLSDLINESRPLTKLIVLSACETGKGKVYYGEGVFSFNRGFAALGIPSAITNLWSVDNESTYRLTELFYKWLSKDLPIDIALQKAKLEFLKNASREKSMPFYWAAPVLVGKSDPIHLEKSPPWKWIALLLGVGCIVFFAAHKWATSKKAA